MMAISFDCVSYNQSSLNSSTLIINLASLVVIERIWLHWFFSLRFQLGLKFVHIDHGWFCVKVIDGLGVISLLPFLLIQSFFIIIKMNDYLHIIIYYDQKFLKKLKA